MAQVPTAIAHLLDASANPLITCTVRNTADKTRRVRVTSFVQGYSARRHRLVRDQERQGPYASISCRRSFRSALRDIDELTRATLHIKVDDLDGEIEVHRTRPIWLLPQTTAPLAVKDPDKDTWSDLTRYLGAFVTPNAPAIEGLLRTPRSSWCPTASS